MYSKEEVQKACLDYFDGDDLATDVILKYLLQNESGQYLELTPTDMHHRLAKEFARIEANYSNAMSEQEIFELFDKFQRIIPQGSPMSGIGNNIQLQSLSNCFVIDSPKDSYGGILFTDQEEVQIMKRRGGVGFDISTIRPKGMTTSNAAKTTDGIGIFMERFSNSCREVAQGGRRGALMQTIACNHYEIETFINIKRNLKKVTGANISIRISDEFMHAVENDLDFTLQWPVDVPVAQAKITKSVKAKKIWEKIIDSAWTMAEPGLLFWDTVKRNTPSDCYSSKGYASTSVNPCAELVLSPYDSCRLMVINTLTYVNKQFENDAQFDFEKFENDVYKAQRLMDDMIDLEVEMIDKIIYKISNDSEDALIKRNEQELWEKIRKATLGGRRTGLGVTAIGDTLAALNLQYGSDESISAVEKIYMTLAIGAYKSSIDMSLQRGAFSIWDSELEENHDFLNRITSVCGNSYKEKHQRIGRRNIALLTTAPVGSCSLLTKTTSGIEPAFLLSYKRRRKIVDSSSEEKVDFIDASGDKWQEYIVHHPGYKKWMEVSGKTDVTDSPYYKSTSNDIDWISSVKLQAASQRFVCHAISKTCNLPNSATKELVSQVYMEAWKRGCKGFTVYRDGCRMGVLTAVDEEKPSMNSSSQPEKMVSTHAPKRPRSLPCEMHKVNIRAGDASQAWLVLIGLMDNQPYEVFCGLAENVEVPRKAKEGFLVRNGKKDGLATYNLRVPMGGDNTEVVFKDVVTLFDNPTQGTLTRTLSLTLRHGIPVNFIVEQLQKDKSDMMSFSKVIARVLKGYIPDGTKSSADKVCPSCGFEQLKYQEGCVSCSNCSFSKCA